MLGLYYIQMNKSPLRARGIKTMRKQMFYSLLIFSLIILFAKSTESANVKHSPFHDKRVMVLGDSITRSGIYYKYIDYYLRKSFPYDKIDIVGIGLGSETVSGLSENHHRFPRPCVHERLDRALTKVKPDIVLVCYGMNCAIYHPFSKERFKAYQEGIMKLIVKIKASEAKVIVLTPPTFDPQSVPSGKKLLKEGALDYGFRTPFYKYNDVLGKYAQWIMQLNITDVTSIDIHTSMQQYIENMRKKEPSFSLSKDGIHPLPLGHLLMARILLQAMDSPCSSKILTEELVIVEKDPLYKLIKKQSGIRSKGWLDFVGYTRDKTVQSDSIDQIENEAQQLQKEIDSIRQKNY